MYISRIKLFNWKNFHDCEVALSERKIDWRIRALKENLPAFMWLICSRLHECWEIGEIFCVTDLF